MRRFRNMPIKWKLMLAMMLTSVITLVLLCPALFLAGFLHLRNLTAQETAALAEIVGGNCAGMMAVHNAPAAAKQLNNLEARASVEDAFLYDNAGELFASYTRRDLAPRPPPPVHEPRESLAGDHLELYRQVQHDGVPVGTICLRANTQLEWARLQNYVGVGAVVMGISMLVALIFARRLEQIISRPILELARVAQGVTKHKDFTLRAVKMGDDETGVLTEAFNRMLAIIQEHDSGSRVSHSRLEKHVAERITELHKVNEALRESEERLQAAFEKAMDGFLLLDAETQRFVLSNSQLRRMLGCSADEIKQLTLPDIHLAEDLPRITETFARMLRGEISLSPETRVRRKDGTIFYADINAGTLTLGGRLHVMAVFHDVTKRKRVNEILQRRLAVEQFVASVSHRLANTAPPEAETAVQEVLAGLGRLTQTDRCYLFRVSDDLAVVNNTHEWCAPGARSQIGELQNVPVTAFPWMLARLRDGDPLLLSRTADLPAEAAAEKNLMQTGNVLSAILVPIRHTGALVGIIGCDATRAERDWSDEDASLLRTIGEQITDTLTRLRIGKALRESEARLQLAIDAAQIGPWHWNLVTGEVLWSPQCLALFGLPAGTVMTHERFLQAVHPDDRERVQAALREAIENHLEYVVEKRVLGANGSVRWLAARGRCNYDDAGRPLHIVGVTFDITDRKRAEEALRQAEAKYRSIFENAAEGIFQSTPDGKLITVNPAFAAMHGYASPAECLASIQDISRQFYLDPERRREWQRQLEERGEVRGFENHTCRKDGSTMWVSTNARVTRDSQGKVLFYEGFVENITERKQTEDALRESEDRLRIVLNSSRDVVYRLNLQTGQYDFFSQAVQDLTGYSDEELFAKGMNGVLDEIHPNDLASVKKALYEAQTVGMMDGILEYRFRHKNGEYRWLSDRFTIVQGADARLLHWVGVSRDITERKRAEEVLCRSEADLAEAQRVAKVGNWSFDIATNWVSWSEELHRIFEIPKIGFDYTFEAFLNRVHPEDRTAVLQANAMAQAEGKSFDIEYRILTPAGGVKTLHEIGYAAKNEAGRIIRLFGTAQDISARKRAEAELRTSEDQYRALAEAAHDIIFIVDRSDRVRYVNSFAARQLNRPPEQIIGQPRSGLFPPQTAEHQQRNLQKVFADGQPVYVEDELPVAQGGVSIGTWLTPLRSLDGGVWAVLGISRDITERRRAEQRLQLAQRAGRVGVFDWDLRTQSTIWTPELEEIFGLPPGGFDGNYASWARHVHPDDLPRLETMFAEWQASTRNHGEWEYRITHPTGEVRWIASRARIFRDDAGRPARMIGTNVDITELRRAEEALKALNEALEQRVAERTAAWKQQARELERSEALLRAREEQLQFALDSIQAGAWDLDLENHTATRSLRHDEIFGYQEMLPQWTYAMFMEHVLPDDRKKVDELFEEAVHRQTPWNFECRIRRADGNVRWIRARGQHFTNRQGRRNLVGLVEDITDRKEAEEALRLSEEQYRVLIETTDTGFVVLDAAGRILDANAEYVRLTGHDKLEEIRGRSVTEWTAPHDQKRNVTEVKKCVERGFIRNMEIDYVNRKQQITPIEINATVVGKGEGTKILSLCRDITERRHAEEALRQSEEKFRRIAAHIQDVLYSVDVETREFRYLSPAFEKMLGYTEDDIRNMGGRAAFLNRITEQQSLNPNEQARRLKRLKSQPEEGTVFHDEEWWRCKDGSLKCIEDRWMPVYESGRLATTEGLLSDITERKRAEDALRQSEKQFRAIFEMASVGMAQADPQTGRLLHVNQKMCAITGYPKDELLARRVSDITHPDDRGSDWVMFQRVVRGEAPSYHVEKRYVRKDGTMAWVNVNMTVIRDAAGQPVRTMATIEDITERKRAEVALTESEERYRSLVDNLNVGVYRSTAEANGHFLKANPALVRMHGYDSVDEFSKISVVDLYENPADRQVFLATLLKTGAVTNHEVHLKKKDGNTIFCAITAKAHYDPHGKVDWTDGVIEDITERKRLERQLLEISEREQRRIGQDLHDGLCQHLAGVGYMSKALAKKLDGAAPAEAADARALADLIRQAIADARATASGLYPVKMETNGIMAALQALAASAESLFQIQCVFRCDPPVLLADNNAAIHLYRIAQEAMNNALRHGKARRIGITLAQADGRVTLTVRDNGQGLPDPLPARRGIGLDIMNHRARMISGVLDIRRAPEGGTILTCSFPLTTAP